MFRTIIHIEMRTIQKHITITLFLTAFITQYAQAQCTTLTQCCLPNGNFAQSSCIGESAFLGSNLPATPNNCVTSWTATHGSPGLYSISHTSNYALLASGNAAYGFASEGIRANFNFTPNTSYDITFKIRCQDPFNTNAIHNPGILSVRAMNNGPTAFMNPLYGLDHTMPALPTSNALITNITTNVLPYVGQNWETVTVSFVPTVNYSQIWFYLNSLNNSQSIVLIDDVSIALTPPTSVFHMQATSNPGDAPVTQFTTCQQIYLNGLASTNDQNHYIDVWRKASGSGSPYVWVGNYGASGWTSTPAGVVNITNSMDITFSPNYDYRIKMATQNACNGWVESTRDFSVIAANPPNPVVQIESNTPGFPVTAIPQCNDIYLVETYESTHGYNYANYFIDLWVRDYNLGGQFQWIAQAGSNGWTAGVMPQRVNIKSIFNNQGITFQNGKEYQVKLALGNACSPWTPVTTLFHITPCVAPSEQPQQANNSEWLSSENEKLIVTPNPAENTIMLSVNECEKVMILNTFGQTIYTQWGNDAIIDVSTLSEGLYLIVVITQDGGMKKGQFIKK